jgi:hypothetical protein
MYFTSFQQYCTGEILKFIDNLQLLFSISATGSDKSMGQKLIPEELRDS